MSRKSIGLVALIYSGMISAGAMGDNNDQQHWSVAGKALYFKTLGGKGTLPEMQVNSSIIGNTLYVGSQFPYSWGVNIDAFYNLDSKYDMGVSWYNVNSKTSFVTNKPGSISYNFSFFGSATLNSILAQSTSSTDWNAINLEFGRKTNLDNVLDVRVHAGGQYARIHSSNTLKGSADLSVDLAFINVNNIPQSSNRGVVSTINAFGPRLGVDLSRKLAYGDYNTGFDIYAKGATSVLAGPNNTRSSTKLVNNAVVNVRTSNTSVIPEFEGKLGVNYDHPLYTGTISFDAGWMWLSYLNLKSSNQAGSNSSFSLEGLYFGLRWLA